ncbi:unnamed protein product [Fraxinus pennsylvanica]|uniref:BHLH domain-containing protein n=1 Tax=Fraxinus pennsylvanica TaxID=56036 RepID=A0AAD2DP18_9LAMI|nr:unnamed protein product [Fraxinus pennsylvanica]
MGSLSSDLGVEHSSLEDQYDFMDFFEEDLAALLGEDSLDVLFPESNFSSSFVISRSSSTHNLRPTSCIVPNEMAIEPPSKQRKLNNHNSSMPNFDPTSFTPIILNFSNVISPQNPHQVYLRSSNQEEKTAVSEDIRNPVEVTKTVQKTKKTSRVWPPSQTNDHIIAERKRRELLSRLFAALAAIVPGLKKMNKTSILGDAIKYLKHLQERVNALEEQVKKQHLESVDLVKRSQLLVEDEGSYEKNSSHEQPLPEIEARVCNNHIHLRIHIKKHKGFLSRLLSEVEMLELNIVSTNVTPFGSFALDITIIAEIDKESKLSLKEIVRTLGSALRHTP